MATNDIICLPQCTQEGHGQMEIRATARQTPEQKWCGTWYDCIYPGCACSVLFPTPELMEMYKKKRM